MTAHLYIDRLVLHPEGGVSASYDSDLGGRRLLARQHRLGDLVGAVAVRLTGGGSISGFGLGSSLDVTVRTRVIEALTRARDDLARLSKGRAAPRRCPG